MHMLWLFHRPGWCNTQNGLRWGITVRNEFSLISSDPTIICLIKMFLLGSPSCRSGYKWAVCNTCSRTKCFFSQTTADGWRVQKTCLETVIISDILGLVLLKAHKWHTPPLNVCACSCACNKCSLAMTVSNDLANYAIQALLVPASVVFLRPQVPATKTSAHKLPQCMKSYSNYDLLFSLTPHFSL